MKLALTTTIPRWICLAMLGIVQIGCLIIVIPLNFAGLKGLSDRPKNPSQQPIRPLLDDDPIWNLRNRPNLLEERTSKPLAIAYLVLGVALLVSVFVVLPLMV